MTKIIKINDCLECYSISVNEELDKYICYAMEGKIIECTLPIPDWCPLEDYKEKVNV